jgi:hypothetical protein
MKKNGDERKMVMERRKEEKPEEPSSRTDRRE